MEVKGTFMEIMPSSLFRNNLQLQCQLVVPLFNLTIIIQLANKVRQSYQQIQEYYQSHHYKQFSDNTRMKMCCLFYH